MLVPMPLALLRVGEATPFVMRVSPLLVALVVGAGAGVACGVWLWYRRFRRASRTIGNAPAGGEGAARTLGVPTREPVVRPPLGSSAVQVGAVLSRLDEALGPLLGEAVSLDVLNASAGRPLLEPERLEQVLVQLALTVRDGMHDGGIVTMRAYDGLGDVTRSDGRRTWTIIEVGKVDAPSYLPPAIRTPAASEQGMLEVRQIVDEVGGRLATEQRAPGNAYFVLQLPSLAA